MPAVPPFTGWACFAARLIKHSKPLESRTWLNGNQSGVDKKMSTRITSAQGESCALSVGESLLSQQELSAPESIGTTETSTGQLTGDAQDDAQLTIDAAQAHWHLDLLGRDERDVHIRAIPHKGKAGGAINGNFAMDLERFQDLNNQGYGIYLQPNIGGTKAKDITLCTTQFFEHDDRPRSEQVGLCESLVGLKPTFQVDTQGKSVHNYLVLENPIEPALWTVLMDRLQLAAEGCDRVCKGTNRMMRMAGSHYINRSGESQGQVQIINADGPRYSAEELDAVLPSLPVPSQPKPKKSFPGTHGNLATIAEALDHIPRRKGGDGTYGDYMRILWGLKAAVVEAGYSEQVAVDLMEAHSPSKQSQWNVDQVCHSGGEQIGPGTFWWHCQQHGWRGHE